jgi:hypothetical protein
VKPVKRFLPSETFKRTTSSFPLESHVSHLSVVALECCKEGGVTVLYFPRHFSHKLQPQNGSVCGPLNLCQSCM